MADIVFPRCRITGLEIGLIVHNIIAVDDNLPMSMDKNVISGSGIRIIDNT